MTPTHPQRPDDNPSGGQLFEFVDEAHEVTDEERNRPRYGRPARKPDGAPTEPPKPTTGPKADPN
jgi:hypothetical protein